MFRMKISALAFAAVATVAISGTSASAQLAPSPAALGLASAEHGGLTEVQYRGRRGWHGHRGWRGGRHYYGRRGGIGAGVIGGLAAGAIIGGAIAAQQPAGNAVAYCQSRFRSYDPSSGTYLGYDGLRHACP
jgi:hypothetical protein